MSEAVWDASALLALLGEEPGADELVPLLPSAAMSAVNLSEVAAKLLERGMPSDECRQVLGGLPLEIHAFDEDMAFAAAALRPSTRSLGLSFGDRACLALALGLRRPVLTADRAWRDLDLDVPVRQVRGSL